jgi:outer membrane lipoprotein-sorting protein
MVRSSAEDDYLSNSFALFHEIARFYFPGIRYYLKESVSRIGGMIHIKRYAACICKVSSKNDPTGECMNALKPLFRRTFSVALLSILCFPAISTAEDGSADQLNLIVASVVEVYGGKDAVAKVKSVVAKGTITDFMKEKQGAYARYYARPQKLRIEIMPDQGGEARVLDGAKGWQGGPEALKEARPITLQSMVYQYSYLDLPMGLADKSYSVSYGGKKEYRGKQVDLLLIEVKGAPKLRVYIDPEKRLIVRVASDFDMGMGSSELSTEYEDFRLVGKVLFPFRLINYAGEMKLSVIALSEIQVNADIPKEKFSPDQFKTK